MINQTPFPYHESGRTNEILRLDPRIGYPLASYGKQDLTVEVFKPHGK
jgi:hypothetical protein